MVAVTTLLAKRSRADYGYAEHAQYAHTQTETVITYTDINL